MKNTCQDAYYHNKAELRFADLLPLSAVSSFRFSVRVAGARSGIAPAICGLAHPYQV